MRFSQQESDQSQVGNNQSYSPYQTYSRDREGYRGRGRGRGNYRSRGRGRGRGSNYRGNDSNRFHDSNDQSYERDNRRGRRGRGRSRGRKSRGNYRGINDYDYNMVKKVKSAWNEMNELNSFAKINDNSGKRVLMQLMEKIDSCKTFSKEDELIKSYVQYLNFFFQVIKVEKMGESISKRMFENASVKQLVDTGNLIQNTSVMEKDDKFFGMKKIEIDTNSSFHQLKKGSKIQLGNSQSNKTTEGYVLSVSKNKLTAVVDSSKELDESIGNWEVGKLETDSEYGNMYQSMLYLFKDLTKGLSNSEEEEDERNTKKNAFCPFGSSLSKYIFHPFNASVYNYSIDELYNNSQMSLGKSLYEKELQREEYNETTFSTYMNNNQGKYLLNNSQYDSIKMALKYKLSCIHGPPGCGKTHTIIQFIRILRDMGIKDRILVSSYTNVSVDNLLQGLVDNNINAVRIGKPVRVKKELRNRTLDAHMEKLKSEIELIEEIRNDIEKVRENLRSGQLRGRDIGMAHASIGKNSGKLRGLMRDLSKKIIGDCDVVCSTCNSAGNSDLNIVDFPIVIIDECSQILEPSTLIPIMKGSKHLLLVGDHNQLPPFTYSPFEGRINYKISLLERLIRGNIVPYTMLNTQYRMNKHICEFPSKEFYKGNLHTPQIISQTTVSTCISQFYNKIFPKKDVPQVFINCDGISFKERSMVSKNSNEEELSMLKSKRNDGEVKIVKNIVKMLLGSNEKKIKPSQIGVISFYSLQIQNLCRELDEYDISYVDKFGEIQSKRGANTEGDEEEQEIEIKSVDSFQGREKDIIIISCVRNNEGANVGFLNDWRRMNVAITRAKIALIIVGNKRTLQSDKYWGDLISHFSKNNILVDAKKIGLH